MQIKQLQAIVEGALLAAGEPLSLKRLETLFEEDELPAKEDFNQALAAIAEACEERGFELKEVASGWRLQVREDLAPWVNRLWEEKPQKYSRALLETLALIAYRQPITRGDIEEIRGVAVSSHIIKTLTERDWVKVVGQRDVPGRPSLYATTRQFLDYFNLKSLDELPTLSEIRDFDELNNALDLGDGSEAPEGADAENGGQSEAVEAGVVTEIDHSDSDVESDIEGESAADADSHDSEHTEPEGSGTDAQVEQAEREVEQEESLGHAEWSAAEPEQSDNPETPAVEEAERSV